jgi:hypothetical protein
LFPSSSSTLLLLTIFHNYLSKVVVCILFTLAWLCF